MSTLPSRRAVTKRPHADSAAIATGAEGARDRGSVVRRGCFEQIHIDAARFATDDFNPFHDPDKWRRIANNPFPGPLALGFQLEALVENLILHLPDRAADEAFATEQALAWTQYDFTFASPLSPGDRFEASVRGGQRKRAPAPTIVHRVLIRTETRPVLLGSVRRLAEPPPPLTMRETPFTSPLRDYPDRFASDGWFLKRKFASTGHAKNFLAGSLARPADWFDELEGRVSFPDLFPPALLSCALLEQAHASGHDFFRAPLVYTTHRINVHRQAVEALRSNEPIHLLVRAPEPAHSAGGSGGGERLKSLGLVYAGQEDRLLAQAEVQLAPLAAVPPSSATGSPD